MDFDQPTVRRAFATTLALSSALLVLSAGALFFGAWTVRDRPFWPLFWGAGGAAFLAYGIVTLLALANRIPALAMELVRPVLQLGAILLALVGAAWPVQVVIRWRQTGDLEAYGVVIGLIMLAQGIAAFAWLMRPRLEPGP
jgi:drug/metabolite transporter (DMT)-like permease